MDVEVQVDSKLIESKLNLFTVDKKNLEIWLMSKNMKVDL